MCIDPSPNALLWIVACFQISALFLVRCCNCSPHSYPSFTITTSVFDQPHCSRSIPPPPLISGQALHFSDPTHGKLKLPGLKEVIRNAGWPLHNLENALGYKPNCQFIQNPTHSSGTKHKWSQIKVHRRWYVGRVRILYPYIYSWKGHREFAIVLTPIVYCTSLLYLYICIWCCSAGARTKRISERLYWKCGAGGVHNKVSS